MRKILVLRGGALGDFIVTLPALALLRDRWPEARIELIGNATAAALATQRGLLDAAHSQHDARWSALCADAPLPATLATWLAEFDLVLNTWPDADGALRRKFPVRSGQRFLTTEAMPAHAPAAVHYCEPFRELGLVPKTNWTQLASPVASPTTIAVHPGSGSPRKNWPLERWREVIATLPAPVLLIRGEAERWSDTSSRRWIEKRVGDNALHLADNLPLEQLVGELTRCRLFLGHDSGISHLAAACGVPSILLFGPTDPARWAPPAPHVRVIHRGPELAAISVADVQRELASALRDRR